LISFEFRQHMNCEFNTSLIVLELRQLFFVFLINWGSKVWVWPEKVEFLIYERKIPSTVRVSIKRSSCGTYDAIEVNCYSVYLIPLRVVYDIEVKYFSVDIKVRCVRG
jgi:hypothetical protein